MSTQLPQVAPAASTDGCAWSIATVGSFCLFCENGETLLPDVTSVSPPAAEAPATRSTATPAASKSTSDLNHEVLAISPPSPSEPKLN